MTRSAMVMEKFRFIRALIFFLASCSGIRVSAQVSTATLAGVVQDSSKASIPGASVKLINTQTGAENDTTTSHDGGFVLPGVIPGDYTLQIERQGFATTQLRGLILNIGDTKDLLIRMKVGPVAESVTVDASGLTLNSTDGSVSMVVNRKLAEGVPLNGRSFQDLISMTPGIVTQSPQAAGQRSNTQGEFSVNGQPPEANSFFVDGISADSTAGVISGNSRTVNTGSAAGATALGTTQSLVSIEALQEFRVLSSSLFSRIWAHSRWPIHFFDTFRNQHCARKPLLLFSQQYRRRHRLVCGAHCRRRDRRFRDEIQSKRFWRYIRSPSYFAGRL